MVHVYLYVPNLIGYSRVIFAALAFYYVADPLRCMVLYSISAILDVLDGHAARYLDQCSRFGAVLDMVTDRCGTTCLLLVVSSLYPEYALAFQFLISLDISSHYIHMYSSLLGGSESHKKVGAEKARLLQLYYSNQLVLFSMCAGNELFFISLYLLHHNALPILTVAGSSVSLAFLLACVSMPICALKQIINVVQFVGAANHLVEFDTMKKQEGAKKTKRSGKSN